MIRYMLDEDRFREMLDAAMGDAQALAKELLWHLGKLQPMPGPFTTAVACRLVALYAARSLMLGNLASDEAIAQAFDALDAATCARLLLTGAIQVDDSVFADTVGGGATPRPLTEEKDDPTLFDIDSWEEP